jgi:hypothetical protein
MVSQIREQWPNVKIVIRADSAFSRDDIMSWCEEHGVDYVCPASTRTAGWRPLETAGSVAGFGQLPDR